MTELDRQAILEEKYAYYLELVKSLPKIDVNDQRVQAILVARERGDEDAERAVKRSMDLWMNNYWTLFRDMRANKLEDDPSNHLLYLDKVRGLGEVWETFTGKNQDLLVEIDEEIGRFKPVSDLSFFVVNLVTISSGLTIQQALEKIDTLDVATEHPLGMSAIHYAGTDRLNPLLKRAWIAMEEVGIDPMEFTG